MKVLFKQCKVICNSTKLISALDGNSKTVQMILIIRTMIAQQSVNFHSVVANATSAKNEPDFANCIFHKCSTINACSERKDH